MKTERAGRGPYNRPNANPNRIRRYEESPPECGCGCGVAVTWDYARNRWRPYTSRKCYRPDAIYKDAAWLRRRYVDELASISEIADECGVVRTTIRHAMRKMGIAPRTTSASLVARGSMSKERNPSWKGGCADWDYAPEWKRIARSIRQRDGYQCQSCGEIKKHWGNLLHVHHIDGDKLNNDPTNLVAVCASCHPRGSAEVERRFREGG